MLMGTAFRLSQSRGSQTQIDTVRVPTALTSGLRSDSKARQDKADQTRQPGNKSKVKSHQREPSLTLGTTRDESE